jgi:thiol:disulfide interchange protein
MPLVLALLAALLFAAPGQTTRPKAGYDPTRDPAKDLAALVPQTKQDGRRIMLVVGGEWCGWCHTLERYLKENAEIGALWSKHFATLKVNMSTENPNEAFLKKYPSIRGYPHLFVLDKDGTFLHSQGTGELESGSSYSAEKMREFLTKWAGTKSPRLNRSAAPAKD